MLGGPGSTIITSAFSMASSSRAVHCHGHGALIHGSALDLPSSHPSIHLAIHLTGSLLGAWGNYSSKCPDSNKVLAPDHMSAGSPL